jgi:hypothetical protein
VHMALVEGGRGLPGGLTLARVVGSTRRQMADSPGGVDGRPAPSAAR